MFDLGNIVSNKKNTFREHTTVVAIASSVIRYRGSRSDDNRLFPIKFTSLMCLKEYENVFKMAWLWYRRVFCAYSIWKGWEHCMTEWWKYRLCHWRSHTCQRWTFYWQGDPSCTVHRALKSPPVWDQWTWICHCRHGSHHPHIWLRSKQLDCEYRTAFDSTTKIKVQICHSNI